MKPTLTKLFFFGFLFIALTGMKAIDSKKYVKFSDKLYASKYELTNIEYREFLTQLHENNELEKLSVCLPDSALWTERFEDNYNAPYVAHYHKHPAYNSYPAVNISKQGIDHFCNWLSDKYNNDSKKEFKKVKFRLPTEKEWNLFAAPMLNQELPWQGEHPYEINKKGKKVPFANIKIHDYSTNSENYVWDNAFITSAVGSYKANKLGLFDIIGNVAEYTSDGKIKGGSWENVIEECFIDKVQDFQIPDPRVGFRLVMEVMVE
ncbi:MAG: SUMF1/EgtB/PvdO family nonheme iron enzyme [Bacteroidales bacterium]|nr:SUMF1/EgtB/PvdO family nonheme iron enzyme [Bacteroidales bacterium]MDD3892860.1 SUMF1/EgtB/PvdO family nonheme iron enzyme [Bacteroidales bacterium]